MIHKKSLQKFYFIDNFNIEHLKNLDSHTNIIYRNYKEKYDEKEILKTKCKLSQVNSDKHKSDFFDSASSSKIVICSYLSTTVLELLAANIPTILFTPFSYEVYNKETLKSFKNMKNCCKKTGKKIFLSNNINLTIKLRLDGAYIPSFNKDISVRKLQNTKLLVLGSAHNLKEINEKKKQGVQIIFLSPLFKIKKTKEFLGVIKFNIYTRFIKSDVVALGGITTKNIKKIKILNCFGFASISYIRDSVKKNEK